jgi:hypothetical protein
MLPPTTPSDGSTDSASMRGQSLAEPPIPEPPSLGGRHSSSTTSVVVELAVISKVAAAVHGTSGLAASAPLKPSV